MFLQPPAHHLPAQSCHCRGPPALNTQSIQLGGLGGSASRWGAPWAGTACKVTLSVVRELSGQP